MSAWIPKTKNIYDDDYKFLYEYPINYSNINRRLRKIICNNEICHAITENGLIFSWGNDFSHKGTLGLGNNIYQVNIPVLNKILSKVKTFDISLSEEHCAAIDYNNYLYTWGVEEHGELGYYDENEKIVCEPIRVNMNKKPFLVDKIKCGKYYTAGINNKGIPFLFGNKRNENDNNEIIFFSFNNNWDFDLIAKDIYCGEDFLIIYLEQEKILIYSFNDGLFEIKLNNEKEKKINHNISKINIVNKNFYILDEKNNRLFEYVYNNNNFNKPFNIYDYYQNEYEVNPGIKLSIIEMPFFVKFLFFWIECSENEKKEFISQKKKMFYKLNDTNFHPKCNRGPNINEFILFGNNKKKIELIKIEYINLYNKKERHFLFKGENINSNFRKNGKENNINSNNNNSSNIDSSFQSLNIPISKNYGNRNDMKDYNKIKLNHDLSGNNYNINNINNNDKIHKIDYNNYNKKTIKYNYNCDISDNHNKYSISQDKRRNKINDTEYEKEEIEEKKYKINKNIITLDNNDINNNISLNPNKKRENNSFLLPKNMNFKTNDNIRDSTENKIYNFLHIKNNKKRSCSLIKDENNHNHHNVSSITTNINNSKKEEDEFDNILKKINNRKLILNQPSKFENNNKSTKKFLSQIGKTKSKTEMLIKELHETFFGKENHINNNYYSNLTHKNKNKINQDKQDEFIFIKNKENDKNILENEIIKNEEKLNKEKEELIKEEKEKLDRLLIEKDKKS